MVFILVYLLVVYAAVADQQVIPGRSHRTYTTSDLNQARNWPYGAELGLDHSITKSNPARHNSLGYGNYGVGPYNNFEYTRHGGLEHPNHNNALYIDTSMSEVGRTGLNSFHHGMHGIGLHQELSHSGSYENRNYINPNIPEMGHATFNNIGHGSYTTGPYAVPHYGGVYNSHHFEHPKYSFNYEVNDKYTGDQKSQYESRNGNRVVGQYSLAEPDGKLRIVDYTADESGFHADVKRIASAQHYLH